MRIDKAEAMGARPNTDFATRDRTTGNRMSRSGGERDAGEVDRYSSAIDYLRHTRLGDDTVHDRWR